MNSVRISRRLAIASVCTFPAMGAFGQQFPNRPIRVLIGFAAGGSTDAVARYYAQKMSERLKTPVIVDNKPGAGQIIAIKSVMAAPPDGYTLYLGSGSAFSQGPGVRKDLPYDPLQDFSLIGMVATAPGVILVAPNLPVTSLQELITYAKQHPGELNYGSSGVGSASHLQAEYLMKLADIKMAHIPFKADADIIRDLSTGTVHVGLTPIQGAMAPIASGRVKALVVTGSRRVKGLDNVPSLKETRTKGLDGIDPYTYYGLVGPPGLPSGIVAKLNEAINAVGNTIEGAAQVREKLFVEPGSGSPLAFKRYIEQDLAKWKEFGKVVKLTE